MPNHEPTLASLRIDVTDVPGNTLSDALIDLRRSDGEEIACLHLDEGTGSFVGYHVPTGEAIVTVSHPKMEGQTREITIGQGDNEELFLLGRPGKG